MAYEDFFHLKDAPFRITPDPDYFFPSDVHKEALETLIYSVRAGEGFVQISGYPGTGKTLLIRTLLRRLGDEVALALVLNPSLTPEELMRVILDDLGGIDILKTGDLPKEKVLQLFRDFLLEKANKGIKTIIIVDEAQNLPNDTLEELRLLSNLETEKEKLLQIILVGQIELEEKLKNPNLKQLAQRITIRYRIKPLSREDTFAYIRHRLEVAGGMEQVRFAPNVLNMIFKFSQGIPRRINIVSERALMAAFVEGKTAVGKNHVDKAIQSIDGDDLEPIAMPGGGSGFRPVYALVVLLLLIIAGGGYYFLGGPGVVPQNDAGMAGVQAPNIESGAAQSQDADQVGTLIAAAEQDIKQEKEKRLADLENEVASEKENRLSSLQNELIEQQRTVAAELEQEKAARLTSLQNEVATEKETRLSALQQELVEKQRAVAEELQQERAKRLAALESEIASEKQKKLTALQKELVEQQRAVAAELEQEKSSRLVSMKNEVASEKETRLSALQQELAEKERAVAQELQQEKKARLADLEIEIASEKEKKLTALHKELAARQQSVESEISKVRESSQQELNQWQQEERERLGRELAAEKQRLTREKDELTASIAGLAAEKARILAEQQEAARKAELAKLASQDMARTPHEVLPLDQIVTAPSPAVSPESSAPSPAVVTASPQPPVPSPAVVAASPAVDDNAESAVVVTSKRISVVDQSSLSSAVRPQPQETSSKQQGVSPAVELVSSPQHQASSTGVSPREVFSVPAGQNFLVMDRSARQMSVWQGGDAGPQLLSGFSFDWSLTDGVYILGKNPGSGTFLFNPMTYFWGLNKEKAAVIWQQLGPVQQDIVPVLVYSSLGKSSSNPGQFNEILQVMNSWAEAWRSKNLEHLMTFYGDIFTHYEVDRPKPIIYSREQLKDVRGQIFEKSGPISLNISAPLCLVDPNDPRTAIAIFRQGYGSSVYSDKGVKVMYFRMLDGAEGAQVWKIVAKLWVGE